MYSFRDLLLESHDAVPLRLQTRKENVEPEEEPEYYLQSLAPSNVYL